MRSNHWTAGAPVRKLAHDEAGAGHAATDNPHGVEAPREVGHEPMDSGHGGHADDTSEKSTLVPTTLSQLILPAIILLFIAILVAGPVINAFSSKPTAPPAEGNAAPAAGEQTATATPAGGAAVGNPTPLPTVTFVPSPTVPAPTATTAALFEPLVATQTAVAVAGQQGEVARIPVQLDFEGSTFSVREGDGLLPDWKPSPNDGVATWIAGTLANQIIYIQFSKANEALFSQAKSGDLLKIHMNNGQVFSFQITRSNRAANGPPTAPGEFSVATAMAQDHAGVTLFLTGDPASDRAVVQADFTGTIQ